MNYTHLKKAEIVDRDGLMCRYCGDDLSDRSYELDHIVPKSRGGRNSIENLGVSCPQCNGFKGKLFEIEFLDKAQGKLMDAMLEMEYWGAIVKHLGRRIEE